MRRTSHTPSHTPSGASGSSTTEVARLRTSSSPSPANGRTFTALMTAKYTAMVALVTAGASRIGST
jgi:hypothetical protein